MSEMSDFRHLGQFPHRVAQIVANPARRVGIVLRDVV
jgi:hypothetical protein